MKSIVNENVLAVAENSTQRKSRTMDLRMEKRGCIYSTKNGGLDIDKERICASCIGN